MSSTPSGQSPPPAPIGATTATLAFLGFATGIALRDVLSELVLEEDGLSLAWLVCVTIASLALILLVFTGQLPHLFRKLGGPGVGWRAASAGLLTAVIYAVTFVMLAKDWMGAGLFDMIDYGLAPILTALIGIFLLDRSKARSSLDWTKLALAFVLYATGICMLASRGPLSGFNLIVLAALSPVATAVSDGLTKWLLTENSRELDRLERLELLAVRFLPAALLLTGWALAVAPPRISPAGVNVSGLAISKPVLSTAVAAAFGFCPLYLLCTALGRAGLIRLAAWEFLIPAIAFFGTLWWHPEHYNKAWPVAGAVLVLFGFIVWESALLDRLVKGRRA